MGAVLPVGIATVKGRGRGGGQVPDGRGLLGRVHSFGGRVSIGSASTPRSAC